MKFHSRVSLVTNSSGEVFVARRDQVPDNVDELIRGLWDIWKAQHADKYDLERIDRLGENFDPAELFVLTTMVTHDHGYDDASMETAIASFFSRYDQSMTSARLPWDIDPDTIWRLIQAHPDVQWFCNYMGELELQFKIEDTDGRAWWIYDARHHVASLAVEAGLAPQFEQLAKLFSSSEGDFGQWRWVVSAFDKVHAYDGAELTGEVDDHVYPQAFVYFVCNTLGWYCYHNG